MTGFPPGYVPVSGPIMQPAGAIIQPSGAMMQPAGAIMQPAGAMMQPFQIPSAFSGAIPTIMPGVNPAVYPSTSLGYPAAGLKPSLCRRS